MKIVQSYLTENPYYKNNLARIDARYITFQDRGPLALMLHSVGCPQPSADVFVRNWNEAKYTRACVHAFIDANSGEVKQTLPWNFRGVHCGGSGNNTHIGVEMCESNYITYTHADSFTCSNLPAAQKQARTAYRSAVELFAFLCTLFNLDPMLNICSHKEGWFMGIASGHRDPQHYWSQLGLEYTMDGFRADVKHEMEDTIDMTKEELDALIDEKITQRIGKEIKHLSDIPYSGVQNEFLPLLEDEYIDGGTDKADDATDIYLPWSVVRAVVVLKRYLDAKIRAALTDEAGPDCTDTCPIFFPDDETGAEE